MGLGAHEGPLLSVFDSFLKEHYLTVLYRVALFIADLAGDRTFGQQAKHKILRDFIGTDRDRRGEILMLVECLSRKSFAFGDQHIFTGAEVFEQKAAIFAGNHRLQVGEWIAAAVRTNRNLGQCKRFTGLRMDRNPANLEGLSRGRRGRSAGLLRGQSESQKQEIKRGGF